MKIKVVAMAKERLAVEGGTPVRTVPFPAWPVHDEREIDAVTEVVRSGHWGALTGTQVKAFECEFAAFQGARHAVAVVNGTAALEVALRAQGLQPGDEVITTPYTFIATPNAALLVGALPVFVDIEPDTYLLDPAQIEAAITPRTRAIMPVHLFGCPANMDAICEIAARHGLAVVEDACQAWGAAWRGRPVGATGAAGAFSFQASKNVTAGEGGLIVTNDDALAERVWSLHNVGRRPGGAWYEHVRVGWNYRMTEWQGAILRVQLARLPEQMTARSANAAYLTAELAQLGPGLTPLRVDERVTAHAWHIYALRYNADHFGGLSRAEFARALAAEGIPCGLGYVPLTQSPAILEAFAERDAGQPRPCPIAEQLAGEAIWLTQNMLLGTRADIDDIVAAVAKIRRTQGV
jgi:dTDP-4-amino-4,6-dideoxygalactose transaminase